MMLMMLQRFTQRDTTLQKVMDLVRQGWPKYVEDLDEDCRIYHQYKDYLSQLCRITA